MLKDILLDPKKRQRTIDDCMQLVEDEVASKGGLSGLAIKGCFMVVKKVKPGFVREAVDSLLDEFVQQLEPFYAEAQGKVGTTFAAKKNKIANALLGITDQKASRAKNQTVRKAYEKLRPTAEKHVEAAVPGIARVIEKGTSGGALAYG